MASRCWPKVKRSATRRSTGPRVCRRRTLFLSNPHHSSVLRAGSATQSSSGIFRIRRRRPQSCCGYRFASRRTPQGRKWGMPRIRWRTIGWLIHRELAIDAYRGNFDQESVAQQKITRETTARQGFAGARRGAELGATEGTLCARQIDREEALHRDAITRHVNARTRCGPHVALVRAPHAWAFSIFALKPLPVGDRISARRCDCGASH